MEIDISSKIAVSVIVPVYNVEKYLKQCFDSIANQTLRNIEIILLNDGSTDRSLEICEEYRANDIRIKVYSHENRGLGETRNRGIELAQGEWLFFVDSDDYLSTDYVETLYKKAKETFADIVQGESKMFFEDSDFEILEGDFSGLDYFEIDTECSYEFFKEIFFTHIYKHYAWNKLYKTSFIKKHGIRFGNNKRIFAEDTWFQLQTFHYNPHIAFCSGSYYYYRQRSTSIMHTRKINLLKRQAAMIDDYSQMIENSNGTKLERKICGMIAMDVFTMEALNQIDTDGNFKSYRRAMRGFRNYPAIYESVCSFNQNKAYELEVKPFRKEYMKIISLLYKCKLDLFALFVVWWTYKLTRG